MDQLVQAFSRLLASKRPPRILYHYTSAAGLLGILEQRSVWATDIRYLNDTSEYNYALEIVRGAIAARKKRATMKSDLGLWDVLEKRIGTDERTQLFVASFTERGDLLSQWRAYCSPHGGYSVGLLSKRLVPSSEDSGYWLVRCHYDEYEQSGLVDQALDSVHQEFRAVQAHDTDRAYRNSFKVFGKLVHLLAPAIKHPSFAEEREWRLIRLSDAQDTEPRFRVSRSALVPFHLHTLAPEGTPLPIAEVVVGPTPHLKLAQGAAEELLSTFHLGSADVKQSEVPYRAW